MAERLTMPPVDLLLACSFRYAKNCVIYLVEDNVMRKRGWTTGLLLRHETGHRRSISARASIAFTVRTSLTKSAKRCHRAAFA